MFAARPPTASRGEVVLQPSYFTSSTFICPLREDISRLIHICAENYAQRQGARPFDLFKAIWTSQGWPWMHMKVFDAKTRDFFLNMVMRLFIERMAQTEELFTRVIALFGFYTFFSTQPSISSPPLHSLGHVAIPADIYSSLLSFPSQLCAPELSPFQSCTFCILNSLVTSQIFYVVPSCASFPLNPRDLPREIFVNDQSIDLADGNRGPGKKKGRPTKREKAKKAKDALGALDKWLEKNTYNPQAAASASTSARSSSAPPLIATHILLSHPPTTTRNNYRSRKSSLLDAVNPLHPGENPGKEALERANMVILSRMKKIDEIAAAKGLEVGGEGGERTGLERVERAVGELEKGRGGLLGLLEGGGCIT